MYCLYLVYLAFNVEINFYSDKLKSSYKKKFAKITTEEPVPLQRR